MTKKRRNTNLAVAQKQTLPEAPKRKETWNSSIQLKAVSQTRQDIASWKTAVRAALAVETPRRARIQALYDDICIDAKLTSQLENRKNQVLGATFSLKDASGTIDEDLTKALKKAPWFADLIAYMWEARWYGHSLVEFDNPGGGLKLTLINRRNIEPRAGILLKDENDTSGIRYRDAREFGWWVYEFGKANDLGLLNKVVPHVLMKRFAQTCWSELAEIYGIPPRYLKTNTQDPVMLSRGEQMMRDMGAAAWFIIDDAEELEFAQGAVTNGDVYNNLIKLCNDEFCMLVSGAIIGQDTKNGNESKEKESNKALSKLVEADKTIIEAWFNTIVMPGLVKLGLLPDGLTYEYEPTEDLEVLWSMVKDAMQYYSIDPEWIKRKFGIEVTAEKTQALPAGRNNQSFF